ncbi:MAG: DUF1302 domain-containing protein [Gammaproteobacteria bacterium]|nr:DUF1302 domain-containing protein [Gammaproteobacteria bacterium]
MIKKYTTFRRLTTAAATAAALALSFDAAAYRWEPIPGVQMNVDTTLAFGVQVRVQDRDRKNIGNDNGGDVPIGGQIGEFIHGPGGEFSADPDFNFLNADNGDLNYDAGQLTSAALKGTHELGFKTDGGWSALARFTWLHDVAVGETNRTGLSDRAKEIAETNFTPLDLWVAKNFDLFGRPARVKVGNQVVSWGEDIFIIGGINSVNALDLRRFHTPGTQLKEVFRPAPMIYFNTGVTDTLNFEAYYQFMWNGFRFDPVGTFFSGADVVGRGQQPAFAPTSYGLCGAPCGDGVGRNRVGTPAMPGANVVPIVRPDREAKDEGQFGAALRWHPEFIDAEFAFYYIRYHDKLPFTSFVFDTKYFANNVLGLGYFNEYGEDKDLFGISGNTKVGPVAVGGELSYRPSDSVAIDPSVPVTRDMTDNIPFPYTGLTAGSKALSYAALDGFSCAVFGTQITPGKNGSKAFNQSTCSTYAKGYVEEEKYQAHLTGFYFIEVNSIFGKMMQAVGAAEGYVLAEMAATYYPNLDPHHVPYMIFPSYGIPDDISAGYVWELGLTYPHLFWDLNVTPQIDFTHDFWGTTPNALPFVEDRKSVFVGINFDMNSVWRGQLGYSNFFGGGVTNILTDRDFFSASVSYAF